MVQSVNLSAASKVALGPAPDQQPANLRSIANIPAERTRKPAPQVEQAFSMPNSPNGLIGRNQGNAPWVKGRVPAAESGGQSLMPVRPRDDKPATQPLQVSQMPKMPIFPALPVTPGLRGDGIKIETAPPRGSVNPTVQTPQTPSTPSQSKVTTVSEAALKSLNPNAPLKEFISAGKNNEWGMLSNFKDTPYVKDEGNTYSLITVKPISLGNGLTLPIGTKIKSEFTDISNRGISSYDLGTQPKITFVLPNGKELTMAPDIHKSSGTRITTTTYGDKTYQSVGVPFFNSKTGELGNVSPDIRNPGDFRYKSTVFGSMSDGGKSISEWLK